MDFPYIAQLIFRIDKMVAKPEQVAVVLNCHRFTANLAGNAFLRTKTKHLGDVRFQTGR